MVPSVRIPRRAKRTRPEFPIFWSPAVDELHQAVLLRLEQASSFCFQVIDPLCGNGHGIGGCIERVDPIFNHAINTLCAGNGTPSLAGLEAISATSIHALIAKLPRL